MRTSQDTGGPTGTSTTNDGNTREVSNKVKKVENIHRGSVPALEGEILYPLL